MYNIGTNKKSKGQKLSNGTQSQLGLGILKISQLGPIPTPHLKHYVLREGRELPTCDFIPQLFKGFYM